ncbi:polyprenyl synthetase family protein [Streptomyces sp. NPDC048269]|uniref:polyprenyl synthetase family protein n=1 Tax=Streptomyces sp. NPDC048269 TaxID=3155753 RepID=UPI003440CC6F
MTTRRRPPWPGTCARTRPACRPWRTPPDTTGRSAGGNRPASWWAHGVAQAAAIAELAHIASLHHDDVRDGAATRHAVPDVHAGWGERAPTTSTHGLRAGRCRRTDDDTPTKETGARARRPDSRTAHRAAAGRARGVSTCGWPARAPAPAR